MLKLPLGPISCQFSGYGCLVVGCAPSLNLRGYKWQNNFNLHGKNIISSHFNGVFQPMTMFMYAAPRWIITGSEPTRIHLFERLLSPVLYCNHHALPVSFIWETNHELKLRLIYYPLLFHAVIWWRTGNASHELVINNDNKNDGFFGTNKPLLEFYMHANAIKLDLIWGFFTYVNMVWLLSGSYCSFRRMLALSSYV